MLLGIVETLLKKIKDVPQFKLDNKTIECIDRRLVTMQKYFPVEFQQDPDPLTFLATWKAMQRHSFLVYTGVIAFRDILCMEKLHHFCLLMMAAQILMCRVDNTPQRQQILADRAAVADKLLRYFVQESVRLYTADIAALKMHEVVHLVNDYLRFGPLDSFSAFRFESFLGKLKKLVRGHCHPDIQVINEFSTLLLCGELSRGGDRNIDCLEEYFETPKLQYPYTCSLNNTFKCGKTASKHPLFHVAYKRLFFKLFCLRTDNDADSYCVVNGNVYMNVQEILLFHEENEECIYLCGNTFEIVDAVYRVQVPDDEGNLTIYSSDAVGQVVGRLTQNILTCELSAVLQKVCAVPLMEGDVNGPAVLTDTYALTRFLY